MSDTTTGGAVATRLDLPFAAGEAASGPLTWAQSVMWGPLRWFGKEANQFNIGRTLVLATPVPPDRLLAALRTLIEDHQTLRTHYVESAGQPRQQVAAAGTYEVTVVDDGGDPARVGADLTQELTEAAFDHDTEWPLRVGGVVDAVGRVTGLALVGSHLAFDGWSFGTLVDLLLDRLDGNGDGTPTRESPAPQPLEQAAYQSSEAGRQQSERGLRHWAQGLATAPASMFDVPRAPTGDHPIERHLLDSAAVTAAAVTLAARTRTSFSTVLLGLTTVILTAYNGHDTCVLKLITGNRLDRRSRDLIALNTLDALLTCTVSDVDLLTAIRQVHRPAFDAYRRAQCDPAGVHRVVTETGRRRGVSFDLSAYFNNGHRGNDWAPTGPAPGPAQLADLRRASEYTRLDPLTRSDMTFMVAASNPGDGRCRLGLLVDTAYLPAPAGETIVRGIETLLCDAVTEEIRVSEVAARIGLTPARRGADWVRTDTGWVRPDDVADLVRRAADGATATVVTDRDPTGGAHLTAYVADPSLSPGTLHRRVLDLLPGQTGVAAPTEYVICAAAPRTGSGPAAWRDAPVAARGSGRPA
ncbi:hypothetical protein AWW66_09100 [Micromonospora rosaria]|uniref:Condensation domain-containing protein n=1 Tax=Micromonospora rosaria TaxID=47874 RepID=A0A136PV76_9ACTN|nr:condensation domain-containing protein [Micromonospora rosaria]KXK62285.1 hypothetical protein AWW66_09100 [Micromonospora rosaria]